jgi:hypothetical protein
MTKRKSKTVRFASNYRYDDGALALALALALAPVLVLVLVPAGRETTGPRLISMHPCARTRAHSVQTPPEYAHAER